MKKPVFALLLASAMCASLTHAAPQAGWEAEVRKFDDAYWAAYNRCDTEALHAMNADDLEFYHDLGGVMHGKAQFDAAVAKNICGNPSRKLRREAMAGTVQVYPMMAGGVLYGAVIEGGHQFYSAAPDAPEVLEERARFNSLLLFKDGAWQLARALSYAHAPVQAAAKLAEVQAAPQALAMLVGTYTAKDKMVLTVTAAGNRLIVKAGGSTFELYPTGANNFAMKERAIEVRFSVDGNGKGQGLVVRERGAIVAEASFTGT
ncbi:nuclear transport factor 2 family protein [Massilia sp. S19_KUP03_FR1]|uniref:nuclear transport factor 2 family protein n=1 Tax=Massilia sp. S19_KUP03_FR1 TaxID=3025503 RepID=UPI002FCD8EB7